MLRNETSYCVSTFIIVERQLRAENKGTTVSRRLQLKKGEKVDDDYGWQVVEWCIRQNKGIAVKLINFQITVGSE